MTSFVWISRKILLFQEMEKNSWQWNSSRILFGAPVILFPWKKMYWIIIMNSTWSRFWIRYKQGWKRFQSLSLLHSNSKEFWLVIQHIVFLKENAFKNYYGLSLIWIPNRISTRMKRLSVYQAVQKCISFLRVCQQPTTRPKRLYFEAAQLVKRPSVSRIRY